MGRSVAWAALAGFVVAAAAPGPAPLQPPGRWNVEYADGLCLLTRAYARGNGGSTVRLGMRPYPWSEHGDLLLIDASTDHASRHSRATVVLMPSGITEKVDYAAFFAPGQNARVAVLALPPEGVAALPGSDSVEITLNGTSTLFRLIGTKAAFTALDTCEDDLIHGWGLDPRERDGLRTPPIPATDFIAALGGDQYPASAVAKHEEGTATIIVTIDPKGRVTDCRVADSSGSDALDAASCGSAIRLRYHPAINASGFPVMSHDIRRMTWRIPIN